MGVKNLDPKQVSIAFGPVLISGFADGTYVSVERNEDSFSLMVGADGEAARSKSNNLSGRVTVTLMQTSASNALLSAIAQVDERSSAGDGINPLLVKDNNGLDLYTAETAWIVKPATGSHGREAETREWVFETNELISFSGGNL